MRQRAPILLHPALTLLGTEVGETLLIAAHPASAIARTSGVVSMIVIVALTVLIISIDARKQATSATVVGVGTVLGYVALYGIFGEKGFLFDRVTLTNTSGALTVPGLLPVLGNNLARLILPLPVLAWGLVVYTRMPLRALWSVFAAIGCVTVLATGSRTSSIALAVGIGTYVITARGSRIRLTAIAVALFLASAVAFTWTPTSGSFLSGTVLSGRTQVWEAVIDGGNPVVGYGYGGLTLDGDRSAHNLVLGAWADFGAIGVGLLAAAVVNSVGASVRSLREASAGSQRFIAAASLACLTSLLVAGLAEAMLDSTITLPGGLRGPAVSPILFCVLAMPLTWRGRTRRAPA